GSGEIDLFPIPYSPFPTPLISIGLRFFLVSKNHSFVSDSPAFGRRQEENPANAPPARDEIYAPRKAAVISSQHGCVGGRRFISVCARGEGRRPSARWIEELAVVSGAAWDTEQIPGYAAVARVQREEESALSVIHLAGYRSCLRVREMRRMERSGSESPG